MTSYWSIGLTDDDEMGAQAAASRAAAPPPAPFPETMKALDIDPWESPANVQQGISTVNAQPFVNPVGAAPAPGVQAAPTYTASAQQQPVAPAMAPLPTTELFTGGSFVPPPDTRSVWQKALDALSTVATTKPQLASATGTGVAVNRGPSLEQAVSNYPGSDIVREGFGMGGEVALGGLLMPQLIGTGARSPLSGIGRQAGEMIAPTTYLDLVLAPVAGVTPWDTGLTTAGRGASTALSAAKTGATSYADNALRTGAGAVPPGAVRRTVAEAAPLTSAVGARPVTGPIDRSGDVTKFFVSPEGRIIRGAPNVEHADLADEVLGTDLFGARAAGYMRVGTGPYGAYLEGIDPQAAFPIIERFRGDPSMNVWWDVGDLHGNGTVGDVLSGKTNLGAPGQFRPTSSNIPRGISPTEGEGIMRTAGAGGKAPSPGGSHYRSGSVPIPDLQTASASDLAMTMGELQKVKPRPLNKLWKMGQQTAEQEADWRASMTAWNREYNAVSRQQKIALERDNAAFRASRAAPASVAEAPTPRASVPEASPAGLTDQAAAPPSGSPPSGAGAGGAGDEFAANIRLSKYPEEVRAPIKEWADANPEAVQNARRGVQSDEQVREAARSLVEDTGGDFNKLAKSWKPGQAWNAEEVTAIRGALTDATREVMDAADAARMGGLAEQTRLAEAIIKQQDIQRIVHGVTAEAGRSLRAFRQEADAALAGGDVKRVQELLRQAMGKSDPESIANLSDMIKALDAGDPVSVQKFLRNVNKPDFWDKLHFYWINSILSGPVTQARNISGNIAATAYSPVQRLGSAAIEQPLAAIQGRQAQRFWQEAPASVVGAFQGVPEGVRGAIKTIQTGISPRAAAKLDVRPAPIGGVAGRILGAPTTALGAMDEFFSAINYRSALNAEAVRMARMQGLKGDALSTRIAELVADPPAALMNRATKHADEMVFRGDPGELARAAAYLRTKVPGGRYILPFLNTPANLLKYGVQNSPLGLLDAGAWKKAIAGNPEGADELARAFMGSSIAAALSTGVATGVLDITVAAPVDREERDRFYREGKIPNAVRIPGIGWVEYRQLPMLDTTFTLVGSAVDGIRRGEDVSGIVAQAGTNIGTNLLDKSYMSGIGDLFDALQDPTRYAERYATRQLSGYIPFSGATRQTAGFVDTTVRDPQNLGETLKTQIPGLSKDVPSRLTAFGEDAKKGLPSPMRVSSPSQSDVDKVLGELGVEVGFVGDSIGGRKLTRDQQHLYQEVAGKLTYMDLVDLIASTAWQAADSTEKEALIDKTINRSRTEVRKAFTALLERESE